MSDFARAALKVKQVCGNNEKVIEIKTITQNGERGT